MKKIIWILGLLVLLIGCESNCQDCCVCCNTNTNNPTPYNTYVICDNQEIWDMRGKIREFSCECIGGSCNGFPTERICDYGLWVKEGGIIEYQTGEIVCTETIGADRRCS